MKKICATYLLKRSLLEQGTLRELANSQIPLC